MRRSADAMTECARLTVLGTEPCSIAAQLGVSLRTVYRCLTLPEFHTTVHERRDRWLRDERRRKNGVHRAWLRDKAAQTAERERIRLRQADVERAIAKQQADTVAHLEIHRSTVHLRMW